MKEEIQNCMSWLVNRLSRCNTYNWDNEFKAEQNKESFNMFYEEIKKHVDFSNLTADEAKELRFSRWDDDLWLIPLYLVPILPKGLEVTSIGGEKLIVGKDYIDNDIRCGCVAYGIEIKNKKEGKRLLMNLWDRLRHLKNLKK